jgi:hypothetical protein
MAADRYILNRAVNTDSWSVFDTVTELPAEVEGAVLVGMEMEEADDMVDLLNSLERQRKRKTSN